MGKVNQSDRSLFQKALTEVFVQKFDRELAECPFGADCSVEHKRCMEAIVTSSIKAERSKNRRKWVVALLVAAALLLTTCTVYAYREEIRAYFERVYQNHITITYVEETDGKVVDKLAQKHTLRYVPEGYRLTQEYSTLSSRKQTWMTIEGQYIVFEQCTLDSTNYGLDLEKGETTVISHGDLHVYCRSSDSYTYIWNDGI